MTRCSIFRYRKLSGKSLFKYSLNLFSKRVFDEHGFFLRYVSKDSGENPFRKKERKQFGKDQGSLSSKMKKEKEKNPV